MNLSDEGKNRAPMKVIETQGCRSVLESRGKWRDGMKLTEAREVLWHWSEVCKQKTLIEEMCNEAGVVLLYEPKSHPIFNPSEVPRPLLPLMSLVLNIYSFTFKITIELNLYQAIRANCGSLELVEEVQARYPKSL
jgi:hypothetical protein